MPRSATPPCNCPKAASEAGLAGGRATVAATRSTLGRRFACLFMLRPGAGAGGGDFPSMSFGHQINVRPQRRSTAGRLMNGRKGVQWPPPSSASSTSSSSISTLIRRRRQNGSGLIFLHRSVCCRVALLLLFVSFRVRCGRRSVGQWPPLATKRNAGSSEPQRTTIRVLQQCCRGVVSIASINDDALFIVYASNWRLKRI